VQGAGQQGAFFDHCLVGHGQDAGLSGADRADIGIGRIPPGIGLAGAKDLAVGVELNVDL